MRVLVLDQSQILPWIVRHDLEALPDLEVEAVHSLREAEAILFNHPPDAAVVSVPPAQLDWRKFQHLCAKHDPPIPVLYESCVHAGAGDAGLEPLEGYACFLPKPAPSAVLHAALVRLLAEARRPSGRRPPDLLPAVGH